MKRRLPGTNLSSENNLLTFRINALVIIRVKVKKCEQTLLFIAKLYWGEMSLEVKSRWGLLPPCLPPCFLITAVHQPALQPRWRTGSPWLLDCCDEEAGREEEFSPTVDLQWLTSPVVHGYKINSRVCSQFFTFALMTTGAFSQNVGKLFSELRLVPDNLLLMVIMA